MENFLTAHWEDLIMANYAVDPYILQEYLPHGVKLDLYEGKAYVSLVGFMFRKTKLFSIPVPLLGNFEEVNLRLYVKRKEGDQVKRGVVFINETVPYKIVAWLANKLYKEHYTAIPTKHSSILTSSQKTIRYEWKINQNWNHIEVNALAEMLPMAAASMEEFIFEHYYGYTKINAGRTQEYKVEHPRWDIHPVTSFTIDCDFSTMYGEDFAFLKNVQPDSVFLAKGSPVSVKWKRTDI